MGQHTRVGCEGQGNAERRQNRWHGSDAAPHGLPLLHCVYRVYRVYKGSHVIEPDLTWEME